MIAAEGRAYCGRSLYSTAASLQLGLLLWHQPQPLPVLALRVAYTGLQPGHAPCNGVGVCGLRARKWQLVGTRLWIAAMGWCCCLCVCCTGAEHPACLRTCQHRPSPSSWRTSGPAGSQARQSLPPATLATMAQQQGRRPSTPTPAPMLPRALSKRSSRGTAHMAAAQPHRAGAMPAPAPRRATRAMVLLLQAEATGSSSRPPSRPSAQLQQGLQQLVQLGTVLPARTAAARATHNRQHMGEATGSRPSQQGRCISRPSEQCRPHRCVYPSLMAALAARGTPLSNSLCLVPLALSSAG